METPQDKLVANASPDTGTKCSICSCSCGETFVRFQLNNKLVTGESHGREGIYAAEYDHTTSGAGDVKCVCPECSDKYTRRYKTRDTIGWLGGAWFLITLTVFWSFADSLELWFESYGIPDWLIFGIVFLPGFLLFLIYREFSDPLLHHIYRNHARIKIDEAIRQDIVDGEIVSEADALSRRFFSRTSRS